MVLINAVTGMDMTESANYLGIPSIWHDVSTGKGKLLTPWYYAYSSQELRAILASLASSLSQASGRTDYRSRRLRYTQWTLGLPDWDLITDRVLTREASIQSARASRISLDESMRDIASTYIWARLTGSEWRLAPSVTSPETQGERLLTGDQRAMLGLIMRPTGRRSRILADTLTEFADSLGEAEATRSLL
ncbi:hypothetical protein ACFWAR_05530 [Streptomyces sp. NPDC059917]|uniref:hypothetical protein n=1 Tax=Streptomyces sp. NPDC059917 TaxID=3347002 RepID=UPI003650E2F7